MNELIKLSSARINDETVQTCSARDLHRFLGIGKDFSTWVKAQIERAAFAENVDYVKISGKSLSPKRGNQKSTAIRLSGLAIPARPQSLWEDP